MLHSPGRRTPDPYAQERTAYTYRDKSLIGKIDLLEFLGATDDESGSSSG